MCDPECEPEGEHFWAHIGVSRGSTPASYGWFQVCMSATRSCKSCPHPLCDQMGWDLGPRHSLTAKVWLGACVEADLARRAILATTGQVLELTYLYKLSTTLT